jgi:hypothetical protein
MKNRFKCGVLMLGVTVAGFGIYATSNASAQQRSDTPFTTTLSNITPLVFGMSPDEATAALGTPLVYVDSPPGSEIYLTTRDVGGSGFTFRHDPLYLQFRDGRLTGWKADWSRNWMWK